MRIKALNGSRPHPSYRGWKRYLRLRCEVRGEQDGAVHYGQTNCNYILFPSALLVTSYGYHGAALMARIAEVGAVEVERQCREAQALRPRFLMR